MVKDTRPLRFSDPSGSRRVHSLGRSQTRLAESAFGPPQLGRVPATRSHTHLGDKPDVDSSADAWTDKWLKTSGSLADILSNKLGGYFCPNLAAKLLANEQPRVLNGHRRESSPQGPSHEHTSTRRGHL